MPLHAFESFCDKISSKVGEATFRPDSYLCTNGMLDIPVYEAVSSISVGGMVPGEIRMAIALRLLAGGSYLDLGCIFWVSSSFIYKIFAECIAWVLETFHFPLPALIRRGNWSELKLIADQFTVKTGGILWGTIGSLDGLGIRIKCPGFKFVADPGNFFCRKGFYGLNVQAICDKFKQLLWCAPLVKGYCYDATAFRDTRLFELLVESAKDLYENGVFLVGDSAYPLFSFLMTPYYDVSPAADPQGIRDGFNYFESSDRIWIECSFGESIMHWGIFGRTLRFDLPMCGDIILFAMLLHNFIIDEREGAKDPDDLNFFERFYIDEHEEVQQRLSAKTGERPSAMVSDNNEPKPAGRLRHFDKEQELEILGEEVRDRLALALAQAGLHRPVQDGMEYNTYGHVYMTR
jgi:hypothetical protein